MTIKNRLLLFLKGMAMGVSDLIPGISGGTVALLLGIYKELIKSLKSINKETFFYFSTFNFNKLSHQLNFKFLIPVFFGIISSILFFSKIISFLILNHKILLFSLFFGLIFFSSLKIIYDFKPKSLKSYFIIILGFSFGFFISLINPISTSESFFAIFLSGFIAISAMLLPGISGSYILLMIGKYEFMLESISNLYLVNIVVFSIGALFGILSFSKIIYWLLNNYYNTTIFFLSGLMLGALNKVWPWIYNESFFFPIEYYRVTGENNLFIYSLIIFVFTGFISYNIKLK
jgi:putative membrane protein